MKMRKWFLALAVVLAGALVFAGCDWEHDEDDDDDHNKKGGSKETQAPVNPGNPANPGAQAYYTVNFIVVGGPSVPSNQTVKYGEKVTEPVVRDFSNNIYTVVWYMDQLFTMPYGFSSPVIRDITLYGKWALEDGSE